MVLITVAETPTAKKKTRSNVLSGDQIKFGGGCEVSITDAANVCGKDKSTIRRWVRDGWPKGYKELVLLYASGKVIPESWGDARFNSNDDLTFYEIGSISKDKILDMPHDILVAIQQKNKLKIHYDRLARRYDAVKKKLSDAKIFINKST